MSAPAFTTILVLSLVCFCHGYLPVVMWHGMGDSCCFGLSSIKHKLNETLPGIYVVSLKIGSSVIVDVENSYFLHPDKQINQVCKLLKADPKLRDGFNAIGFSQGSQFIRGLVQRCGDLKVKNLITLGGQHQGVYGLPNCGSLSHPACDYVRQLLNYAAYFSWVQKRLVQATYWHDPLNEELYKKSSTFLSDINNEQQLNLDYIKRIQSLDNFVMVKFENDTMVQPIESEWFGFYKPGQSKEIESLEQTSLYIDDRLGLQKLKEENRLKFLSLPGNHLQFEWPWFVENIVEPFLKN
ncbi:palmitoyl-protein thioesterase 1 [Aethina tumida]|uniref:palmitoyl-protein thioesterase 1 n=1 Tax=Aethina tumida TaxID=116153 RepID=UPI00096B0473|nr:palmitoyl-protein thioesterase 1 [Aethina tumida]